MSGRGTGVLVEEWNGQHGIRMLNLGVEITRAAAAGNAAVSLSVTDRAAVTAELVDPSSGRLIARHDAGLLNAGENTVTFAPADYVSAWSAGDYRVVLRARSTYEHGAVATTEVPVRLTSGGQPALPDILTLIGNTPNPFNPQTTIRFVVPAGARRDYALRIYDVAGRLVRGLASGQIDPGMHDVRWDGTNDRGESVSSGVYLYRINVGADALRGKMVLLK
jgi:hypothetical protein